MANVLNFINKNDTETVAIALLLFTSQAYQRVIKRL